GITGVGRDVSEKKQAEENLKQHQRHLVDAQALAHLGSWDWDIDTGEVQWSDEQFRIFGHKPRAGSVTYDTFLAALLPEDHDHVLAAINDALLGKRPYDVEYRIVRPNGEVRFIHSRGDVHRDTTGHPLSMTGTILDVTERKQTEEALRASEERWKLAVRGSNDGIWDWDIRTGKVFFSMRWKAMRGFEDHEITSHVDEWRSRIHPDDLDRVLQSIDAYLAKQIPEFFEEYRVQQKDGSYMWILDRGIALWADDGTPLRMAGSETDITERKRAEHESYERAQQALVMQTALLELARLDDTKATFSDVIPRVTKLVADTLAVERVGVWLLSEDRTELVCQDLYERLQAGHSSGSRLTASNYPRYFSAIEDSLMVAACDALVDPRTSEFVAGYLLPLGITSMMDAPIRRHGKLIGVVCYEHVGLPREWSPEVQSFGVSVGEFVVRMLETDECKRAEEALRESEELFVTAFGEASIGMGLVAPDGRWLQVNQALCDIVGYSQEELEATTFRTITHPDDLEVDLAFVNQMLRGETHTYQMEKRYLHKQGHAVWVLLSVSLIRSADRTPRYFIKQIQDITERKRAEEALRLTQFAIDRGRDMALWIDRNARILYVNDAACQRLGYSRDELFAMTIPDLDPDYQLDLWSQHWNELKEQKRLRFESRHRTKSGEIYPIEIVANYVVFEGQEYNFAFCRDVTDRKRTEEVLRQRERLLHTVIEERERISQDLHDGILQSLFAVGLALEASKSMMSPRARKSSGASLDQAIDQLNRVMREIRNFTAGLGSDPLQGKDLPMALQNMLASLTVNQATRVRLAVEDRAAKAVSAEQSLHLLLVIQEAVNNCIRHGRAQEAKVSLKMLKQGVRLSIRDNGRGFNPDTAKGAGHGLGNMAARAQKIGGRFTVLSKVNEGTRVVLDLPKEAADVLR
ncbi:MAG: PAS domain S-box protein, partial [Nitrospiraceae bacterium]|nr:PAS domain S-box protein [Nitrospiraceae bacterium]